MKYSEINIDNIIKLFSKSPPSLPTPLKKIILEWEEFRSHTNSEHNYVN